MINAPEPADPTVASVDLDTVEHTAITLGIDHLDHDADHSFDHLGRALAEDVVRLLRAAGAVGWVRDEGPGRVLLMLATAPDEDGGDRLVVLRQAVLVAGPALRDVVAETAARCGAHVCSEVSTDEAPRTRRFWIRRPWTTR